MIIKCPKINIFISSYWLKISRVWQVQYVHNTLYRNISYKQVQTYPTVKLGVHLDIFWAAINALPLHWTVKLMGQMHNEMLPFKYVTKKIVLTLELESILTYNNYQ